MDREKLIKRLMVTFLGELEEHVSALNRDLLDLEKAPEGEGQRERFKTLFRTAHSLKGAARSVNVAPIESACHHLEEVLGAARDGVLPLGRDLFALLFATADAIEEAGMRLREQQDLAGAPLLSLLPRLEAAAAQVSAQPPGPPGAAAAPAEEIPADAPIPLVLPQVEAQSPAASARAPVAPAPQAPATPAEVAVAELAGGGSVRVPAAKLDALLTGSGELLVARRRVTSRQEDVAVLRESVGRWRAEWRAVEKWLKKSLPGDGRPLHDGLDGARSVPVHAGQLVGQVANRLRGLEQNLDRLLSDMAGDGRQLAQAAGDIHEEVRRVRMLPFLEVCQGLERTVRDLAQAGGKTVELVVEGGDVELDRSVLEGLKDPLRHLVRNAVDHGCETPAQRRAAGKPPRARITVLAALRGSQVEVVVADDGAGLNFKALREQAHKHKLPEPGDDRELARLIFLPGLSTARIITDVSGRGVGLDVVKSRVESLHGTIDLSSVPGQGTRFTLTVPLTLTTLRALLVRAAGQTFAFAGTNVQKLERLATDQIRSVAGREVLALGGAPLPVASLADTLGLAAGEMKRPGGKMPALIVAAGERRMAFVVDELLAEQEIVVKGLGARIRRVRNVSGATILPSGQIALVLNAANLIRTALGNGPTAPLVPERNGAKSVAGKRLLVADDSVTTRTLVKSILEAAGYDVATAPDGEAAWQLLQEHGADLLVSDVDMPGMDGIRLTAAVRASPRFQELPVVLVTARESEQDKARGIEAGADAYLIKSAFDQRNLLEVIGQLL